MATIDTVTILSKVDILKQKLENILLKNLHNSSDVRNEYISEMSKELGTNIVTPYIVSLLNDTYTYNFATVITALFNQELQDKIIFIKDWNEEKFNLGKKIYQYFKKINVGYYEVNSSLYSHFQKFYETNENYDDTKVIDNFVYDRIINSDLVIRFINAFSKDARYIPGEFVTVKLGIMPFRVLDSLPEQSRNYVYSNPKKDSLYSPGIILDIVDNKKVEVKNKGRWYKVAVSTPFAIFCVEERHLRKYNPTKDHVTDLFNQSIQNVGKEK